ncbi:MAG: hypothetical protein F4156_01180 [Holophagales bacterium]|nr:hypothetical protein [Holophagales bacterium]
MTRLLVILIAILLAWMWIARMIRGALRSPRAAEARSLLRLLQVLRRTAGGGQAGGGRAPSSRPATGSGGDRPKALLRCRRCGVHVPEVQLTDGVCGSCMNEDRTAQD